jgi:hypothetical protein
MILVTPIFYLHLIHHHTMTTAAAEAAAAAAAAAASAAAEAKAAEDMKKKAAEMVAVEESLSSYLDRIAACDDKTEMVKLQTLCLELGLKKIELSNEKSGTKDSSEFLS